MIDDYDAGMTTASVQELFAALRRELVPIVGAICDQPAADDDCLRGVFVEARQLDFNVTEAKRLGYDFQRGPIDKTHHPFCTKFSARHVRITTPLNQADIRATPFSPVHQSRHTI